MTDLFIDNHTWSSTPGPLAFSAHSFAEGFQNERRIIERSYRSPDIGVIHPGPNSLIDVDGDGVAEIVSAGSNDVRVYDVSHDPEAPPS